MKNISEVKSKGIPRLCHKALSSFSSRKTMQNNASKHWARRLLSWLLHSQDCSQPTPAHRQQTFHFVSRADRWSIKRALVRKREKAPRSSTFFFSGCFRWGSEMMLIYIRLKFASLRFIHCVEFQATFPLRWKGRKKIELGKCESGKGSEQFLSDIKGLQREEEEEEV